MRTHKIRDWKVVLSYIRAMFANGEIPQDVTMSGLAKITNIPLGTLRDAMEREGITLDSLKTSIPQLFEVEEQETGQDESKVEISGDRNSMEVEFKTKERITTLDQLLKLAEVDAEVWEVERWIANKWEVGIRVQNHVEVEPLFQVKAWLTRKVRQPVSIHLQPVEITIPGRTNFMKEFKFSDEIPGTKVVIFASDPQFGFRRDQFGRLAPFHDRRAISVLMEVASQIGPDLVVWGGDMLDLPDSTDHFLRSPEMALLVQPSAIECGYILSEMSVLAAEQVILEGNHDLRLQTAIAKNLAASYGLRPIDELGGEPLLSVPRLLSLKSMDIKWVDGYPNNHYEFEGVTFIHGDVVKSEPGMTASHYAKNYMNSVFFGHIHRNEIARRKLMDGSSLYAGSPGCLCRVDGSVPGSTSRQNWQQGLFIITTENQKIVSVENVQIENGTAFFRGGKIVGEDYLDNMLGTLPTPMRQNFRGF